jgi:hypothetical protein
VGSQSQSGRCGEKKNLAPGGQDIYIPTSNVLKGSGYICSLSLMLDSEGMWYNTLECRTV